MHGSPDKPSSAPVALAQFAWIIKHYRIDLVLIRRHYIRLAVGLTATVLVVAYNAFHLHASDNIPQRATVAAWLMLGFLLICFLVVTIYGWRLRSSLMHPAPSARLRVMQVVDFVHRWGNLLLLLTAIGHGVLVLGTLLGLDLFTRDGRVLLASFAPVLLLLVYGLTQIPTCERLCSLHALGLGPDHP